MALDTGSPLYLPYSQGGDQVLTIDDTMAALAARLAVLIVTKSRGTLAARPPAGFSGRVYLVQDPGKPEDGVYFYDNGTTWDAIAARLPAGLQLGAIANNQRITPNGYDLLYDSRARHRFRTGVAGSEVQRLSVPGWDGILLGAAEDVGLVRVSPGRAAITDSAGTGRNDFEVDELYANYAAVGGVVVAKSDDSRFPSSGQKNALVGSKGSPATANPYVTTTDGRLAPEAAIDYGAGGPLALTAAHQAVPGLSLALPQLYAGDVVEVDLTVELQANGASAFAELTLDGAAQTGRLAAPACGSANNQTCTRHFVLTPGALAAGKILSANAWATASGGASAYAPDSSVSYSIRRANP